MSQPITPIDRPDPTPPPALPAALALPEADLEEADRILAATLARICGDAPGDVEMERRERYFFARPALIAYHVYALAREGQLAA